VIARLDVRTGHLRWVNAGHPPPLVIRDGRRARMLSAPPATPLGVPLGSRPDVAEESLEPGDMLLLYSDGLTEARRPGGELLGVDGLTEFIEHEAAARQPAPETLRRLRHAIVAKHDDRLRDDATALLVEWNRGTEAELLPPTVERPRG
jgi:serine phosphatase RsbU (regulator of sigma subunit)